MTKPSNNQQAAIKNPSRSRRVGHPYRIREIARQAGLSEATVDRVLHQRGGVRESTASEIHRDIAALDKEQAEARLAGPAYPIDVVCPGPPRFTAALRQAVEAELPDLRP